MMAPEPAPHRLLCAGALGQQAVGRDCDGWRCLDGFGREQEALCMGKGVAFSNRDEVGSVVR